MSTPAPQAAPATGVSVELREIVQEYPQRDGSGGVVRVVDRISLHFDRPGINMLLGPSGCGKSTILHMMGGVRPIGVATPTSGEVLVDGRSRGVSPPLRVLEIPAGTHTIEIRNSTFPKHVAKVDVKAGEAIKIRHRFR